MTPFLTLQYEAWTLEVKFGRSLGKQIQELEGPGLKSRSATFCLGDTGQLIYSSCPSIPSFVKWDNQVYLPAGLGIVYGHHSGQLTLSSCVCKGSEYCSNDCSSLFRPSAPGRP